MSTDPSATELEFSELLTCVGEVRLDELRQKRLEQLIRSNTDFFDRYVEYCQVHSILLAEHGMVFAATHELDEEEDQKVGLPPKLPVIGRALATAILLASLLVVCFFSFQKVDDPPFRGEIVANVTQCYGQRFVFGIDGNTPFTPGVSIPHGEYEMLDGVVEIKFKSGATVVIESPARFELINQESIRLENGRIAAHVPEEAIGFTVNTIGGRIVDLGTDFAIDARSGDAAEVHVFDGEVRVHPNEVRVFDGSVRGESNKADESVPNSFHVSEGMAIRLEGSSGFPAGIDLDPHKFFRSIGYEQSRYSQEIMNLDPAVYYRMEPIGDGTQLHDSSDSRANAAIFFRQQQAFDLARGKSRGGNRAKGMPRSHDSGC